MPGINQNLLWYLILVVAGVAMVIGVIWVHRIWSDIKGEAVDRLTEPDDLLKPLSEAFVAGQMSEEEYKRIKQSVIRGITADANQSSPLRAKRERPAIEPSPTEPTPRSDL